VNDECCSPEIEYPCPWGYRVIGSDEAAVREAIRDAVGDAEHELEFSRTSSKGSYVALKLTVMVRNEAHRLGIDKHLRAHPAVRYVL
jgi:putative lipoic acid-binding regulatory protein